jgi:cellulose synthase/poly-beta-1,6-N-acetylglucosamine synthase-like glycosyltransferase
MTRLLAGLVATISAVLSMIGAYLLVLTMAAAWGRLPVPPPATRQRRVAILVPAHNEEALIGRLVDNLQQLDYPREQFAICVVADNCSDATASIAAAHGAQVYERTDPSQQAKGYALRWLLEQMRAREQDGHRFDAFVVLDADSVVDANLLHWMNRYLEAGSQVLQAYYTVLNAGESPVAMLRFAALAALHYVRSLGRAVVRLSCGLKGNGMCFAAPVLERFDWRWFALAEDAEFHLELARAGIRVDFVPQTRVRADMPVSLAQAASQNTRWERGRLQLLRGPVLSLLREGVRLRSAVRLDAALDQLIPPLSVPFSLAGLCLLAAVSLGRRRTALLAGATLGALAVHLLAALVLVRAPLAAYLGLAYAPIYIGWKVVVYARALVSRGSGPWVRTARVPR